MFSMRSNLRLATALACAALTTVAVSTASPSTASATTLGQSIATKASSYIGQNHTMGPWNELWCADFVQRVWNQEGIATQNWMTSYVPDWTSTTNYHSIGSGYTPQPGDAVIYADNTYKNGSHIAIVTNYASGLLSDVGGDENGGQDSTQPWWATSQVYTDEANGGHAFDPTQHLFAKTSYEMWVLGYVSPPGSSAPVPTSSNLSSQVTAIGNDGNIYHEVRNADGSWSGFQSLPGYQGGVTFKASSVAVAGMPGGSSQIVAIGNDGNVYHNIRHSDGTWSGWVPLNFAAKQVSIAAMPDGSAQVLAQAPDGTLYQNIRHTPSGTWQGFQPLAGYQGAATFQASSSAIAGLPDGSSQTIAVGSDGTTYHNIRHTDGTWQGWVALPGYQGGATFSATSVAVAGMPVGGSAQFVAVGNDGNVYHNIRHADGTWQGWVPLNFAAKQVSIAAIADGTAQVLAEAPDGTVYQNIRYTPSGSWQGFRALAGYQGAATFQAAGIGIGGFPF